MLHDVSHRAVVPRDFILTGGDELCGLFSTALTDGRELDRSHSLGHA